MIQLREDLVSIKNYPGYFWSINEKKLYTLKVSGVLRPMKPHMGWMCSNGRYIPPGYTVSKEGVRRNLAITNLMKLASTSNSTHEPYPMAPCTYDEPYIGN